MTTTDKLTNHVNLAIKNGFDMCGYKGNEWSVTIELQIGIKSNKGLKLMFIDLYSPLDFYHAAARYLWGEELVDEVGHTESEYKKLCDEVRKFNDKASLRKWDGYIKAYKYHLQQLIILDTDEEIINYVDKSLGGL